MDIQVSIPADDIGPEKVVILREPGVGLEAILVIDNTAAGPAIGGIRMATDVSVGEVFRLARAMTFKNAAAGLRHGGAKSGIVADPDMPDRDKERLVRALAHAMSDITDYIPGPDMGLTEANMAQIHDEIGRVVGLPPAMGGIPLDTLEPPVSVWPSPSRSPRRCDVRSTRVSGSGRGDIITARFLARPVPRSWAYRTAGGRSSLPMASTSTS